MSKRKSLQKEPYIGDTDSNKKRPVKDNAVSNITVRKGSLSNRKQLWNEPYIGDTTANKKHPVRDKDVGDVSGRKCLRRQNATDSSHEVRSKLQQLPSKHMYVPTEVDTKAFKEEFLVGETVAQKTNVEDSFFIANNLEDSGSTDKNVDMSFDAVKNFGIVNNFVDNKAKEFVDVVSFGEVPNLAFNEETESEYCMKQPTSFDAVENFGKHYNLADNEAKEFDVITSGKVPNLAEKEETESEYCVSQPTLCGNESEHAIQPYSTVKFSNQKIQQKASKNKKK